MNKDQRVSTDQTFVTPNSGFKLWCFLLHKSNRLTFVPSILELYKLLRGVLFCWFGCLKP